MIKRMTAKLFRDKKGSARIYLKKELAQLVKFNEKTELIAEYDDEKKELRIKEL